MIFIGFMGTGKSVVGGRVAALSGRRFVDLDGLVSEQAGRDITRIFAAEGEQGFRQRERQALRGLPEDEEIVLATGGGTLDALDEPDFLRTRGRVFWLDTGWHAVWQRLHRTGGARPLVAGLSPEVLHELYLRRRARYARAADFRLRTDLAGVERVVSQAMLGFRAEIPEAALT